MHDVSLCPKYEKAFEILGKRWTGLIIKVMMVGPKRFSDVSSQIPNMSDRMLGERFKELEELGIIKRNVYPETPVRIEYELTEKGKALENALNEVQTWASKWM
ncbi:MAG: transcriptional regulator, HxlR family [Herbinix sp.]|jgi:DNA-binding HxlR family transcriptional regulator|nr:transcriptional regulator, HxlR family [Herbinix sp.]